MFRHRLSLAALGLIAAACSNDVRREGSGGEVAVVEPPKIACVADNGGLTLPTGFCASVFADSVEGARHFAIASNGDVFVQRMARTGEGIYGLRDTDGDGKADTVAKFGKAGGTGIALYKGYLYADEMSRIVRYPLAAGALAPTGEAESVVDSLPTGGHAARNFVIDANGNLFLNVGSKTNSCQEKDRGNELPGVDPCVELETRAGIWRFDANTPGQRFSSASRYATGIRNAVGIALGTDGHLWSTQHGRDQLMQNWQTKVPSFDATYSANNPAEELLRIDRNDDFGWPYCYWSNVTNKLVTAPEYGGDGAKNDRCTSKKAPVAAYPGHWAPNGLAFYNGANFPAKYKGGAFIAFHGSWNRAPEPQDGFNVVFQPIANNAKSGAYEVFADGFAGPNKAQGKATYRPTGLAVMPDGSLLIGADQGGRLWKVAYKGQ